ncbi:MAG: LuxR C-terminal-related transcriptional regulator [Gammaproteobacteria bacterium]|nr:LuxR C-terminal-related transcriptional regulator [Gammaproteobacteria bacterium]
MRQKVAIPEPVPGYVHRPELVDRATPTRRRLTVLQASGGFGKTTLLAECCRRLRREGIATAWISLDEQDEPAVLDAYIALACESAGLDLFDVSDAENAPVGPESRIGPIVREIQSFGGPFVIAFDEVERLGNPASIALLAFLLQRGPSNLHLAIACRMIPNDLSVATALLEGRADVVGAEDLRFSRADTARFFDLRLSRRALAEEMGRSAGWPFALRVARIGMERGAEGGGLTEKNLVGNWMESRLFANLGSDGRNLVLDLGLFDWFDSALVGEVLQRGDAMHHLDSLAVLVGLIEQRSEGATESWRLHPLVREHCANQRFQEDPERFGAIHLRIAAVLARRGETVPAVRHAIEGGDPFLAGEIVEEAGGVRLWIRLGLVQVQAVNRQLTDEVISERPRLKLVRCLVLALSGRHEEARSLYRECPRPSRRGDEDDADFEYSVDHCIVGTGMALYGTGSVGSQWLRTWSGEVARLSRSPRVDVLTRGHLEYARCVMHFLKGEFDAALERLSVARELVAGSQYLELYGELLSGQIDFVKGRVVEAQSHWRKARRVAQKCFLLDPVAVASCDVVMKELALERNLVSTVIEPTGIRSLLKRHGVPFSFFATAINVLINTRLGFGHFEEALAVADELSACLRRSELTMYLRLLAALRVTVLVIAGRIEDAERAWRRETLPEEPAACVDLSAQSWREMEAVSEARARLLIMCGRFDEARTLLRALRAVAADRGFRRIEMRALVLLIMLEGRAGVTEAGARLLTEFLELFAESPYYARSLAREREIDPELVRKFLRLNVNSPYRQTARSFLATMGRVHDGSSLSLTERERQVLRRLEGHRDKEIAAAVGLSVNGVRYHLRKLFARFGASNRAEVVRRAREQGLIPANPDR